METKSNTEGGVKGSRVEKVEGRGQSGFEERGHCGGSARLGDCKGEEEAGRKKTEREREK